MDVGPATLVGTHARIVPLELSHDERLFAIARDESIWTHMLKPGPHDLAAMREYLADALKARDAGTQVPFTILDLASGRIAGSTRFLNIARVDRGLEIGHTWLGVEFQRTAVNTECKLLLLRHAFEELGCVRVQLKTDVRNERSRRAIERLGAAFEGVLRKYQRTRGDRFRDTAMYSITDEEWPAVRLRLEERLARPRAAT